MCPYSDCPLRMERRIPKKSDPIFCIKIGVNYCTANNLYWQKTNLNFAPFSSTNQNEDLKSYFSATWPFLQGQNCSATHCLLRLLKQKKKSVCSSKGLWVHSSCNLHTQGTLVFCSTTTITNYYHILNPTSTILLLISYRLKCTCYFASKSYKTLQNESKLHP